MARFKVSDNFYLDEFVDPETYKAWGNKSIWFIDPKVIRIAQLLRDLVGAPVTINNWWDGGQYKLSGLRPLDANIGAKLSQHKFGRGIDVKVKGMKPNEVHELITYHLSDFQEVGLTTMEHVNLTPTWTHLDVRTTIQDELLMVGI